MAILEFKIDEDELSANLKEDITKEDKISIVTTMFIMPVRFQVNGIELFEYNKIWCEAPIVNIASEGLACIKKLKYTGREIYEIIEGPGDIEFTMVDDINVKIVYEYFPTPVITVIKYDELLKAFEKFAEKVRAFFWERVPQLNDHPYWGPWLRGERD